GARSPMRPRNTSSRETGYACTPHAPTPAASAKAITARASMIFRRSTGHLRRGADGVRRLSGRRGICLGPPRACLHSAQTLLRARHVRALMRLSPLGELLVASEHGVNHLIEHILGGFAQELRI